MPNTQLPPSLLGQAPLFSASNIQASSPVSLAASATLPQSQSLNMASSTPPVLPPQNQKIVRVRSGCWTCKARRRKCDEGKPFCMNCIKNNRQCEGYDLRLSFDVDDSRHVASGVHIDMKGRQIVGFRRRPRLKESLAARSSTVAPQFGTSSFDVSGDVAPPATEATAKPVGRELKFVVQNNFEGNKRPRKKRTNADEDSSAKKVKAEPLTTTPSSRSTSHSSPCATPDTVMTPASASHDVIKQEPTDRDEPEEIFNSNSSRPGPTGIAAGRVLQRLSDSPRRAMELQHQSPSPSVGRDLGMFWSIKPEEQELLQYYFTDLTPILDNLSNSPLAGLAITYCTHDLALSSFLCLASLHLSTRQKSERYYAIGLEYHSRTIKFLGDVLNAVSGIGLNATALAGLQSPTLSSSSTQTTLGIPNISSIRNQPKIGRGLGVAVLTVIYFLITFEILDTGKSATVRSHMAAFSSIIEDRDLAADVLSAPNGMFLFRIFAWYDILLAACAKDYRAPHLSGPYFFPLSTEDSGVEGIMGCPDELMLAISDTCHLRHSIKYNSEPMSFAEIQNRSSEIENRIRNYSSLMKWNGRESYPYIQHMIGTQCWAQAASIFLLRSTGMDPSGRRIAKSVEEFQKLHAIMEVGSDPDRQMVWPMFMIGCELKSQEDRNTALARMDKLFSATHCGSWRMLKDVLQEIWTKNCSWEEVLSSKGWENFDFLAL
ncbi:fungal-specific transcription factor domain-containing protein [Lipomyces tetrasporus]|uniref:Fungal-specific transcription factor domain-containing protein n=1 Tax=Lipomyces tetrasporus TaxID=54092 RepID=A0AAD7QTX2_9ASCO|nr:fungal-specific transcription factor domain-containing protein [Lipomyces tetrasporus]KAJ8101434.1 fungal-specific transcription factor domain-containing protein [Lipomyces tetrasporus]